MFTGACYATVSSTKGPQTPFLRIRMTSAESIQWILTGCGWIDSVQPEMMEPTSGAV